VTAPWEAERVVSAELARALVEAQFPQLAPVVVRPLGVGWDNTALVVNDEWVFRFPRRPIAVDLLATEARLLPAIAPRVPLAVPVPELVGRPDDTFGWPFTGYRLLPGRTACSAGLDEAQRHAAAAPLGRFLRALHAFPAFEASRLGAPADVIGRLALAGRAAETRGRLERIQTLGLVARRPAAAAPPRRGRGRPGAADDDARAWRPLRLPPAGRRGRGRDRGDRLGRRAHRRPGSRSHDRSLVPAAGGSWRVL
jgi:hypothetical protein